MENDINKENNKPIKGSKKLSKKTITELNNKITSILKEDADKIINNVIDNKPLEVKLLGDEEKEVEKKYSISLSTNNALSNEDINNILNTSDIIEDILNKEENSSKEEKEEDAVILTNEEIDEIINKINNQISLLNNKFYSLVKEEEEVAPIIEKLKISKPKSVKIKKETYKQIKAHCKEHNVDIEDWIDKITLNEINRIIVRLGDIDYKNIKKRKKDKKKKKDFI